MRKIQFSHIEIAGILLLSGLLMAIVIILELRSSADEQAQTIIQREVFDSSEEVLSGKQQHSRPKFTGKNEHSSVGKSPNRFDFDPNRISADSLILLGLPAKVAHTLVKYRNKGGKFRTGEDLKKIYGVPESWFANVAPFIKIKQHYSPFPSPDASHLRNEGSAGSGIKLNKHAEKQKFGYSLDVNEASLEDFMMLDGIGQTLSKRIIKYRESLGGFYSVSQVAEVYGINDSLFQTMKDQLYVHEVKLEMIKINSMNIKELDKHPYIDFNMAKKIVTYRDQHGGIKNPEALKKIYLIDRTVLDKLIPYIDFGD